MVSVYGAPVLSTFTGLYVNGIINSPPSAVAVYVCESSPYVKRLVAGNVTVKVLLDISDTIPSVVTLQITSCCFA